MIKERRVSEAEAGGLQLTEGDPKKATPPASVDDYLAALPEAQRDTLEALRTTIKTAAPEAAESINYGVPYYKYKGKALISFGAAKKHVAVYGMSANFAERYKDDLASFDASAGTVRFTPERPLPADFVKKFIQQRIEEIEAKSKKK
jgi:uncharacterized protein YdhG (YjbR/CyaY superfamily)